MERLKAGKDAYADIWSELMRYTDKVDYLVVLIIYLSSSKYWWGRTPHKMATYLGLDEQKLIEVLEGFPVLFRRGTQITDGQYSYSLQARYAQYPSKAGEEPSKDDDIPTLSVEKMKMLIDFVQKMVEHEKTDRRTRVTQISSIAAASLAAVTTILVATEMFKPKSASKVGLDILTALGLG